MTDSLRNDRMLHERADQLKNLVRMAGSFYVSPLFLTFSVADYIWYPTHFVEFLIVRALVVALALTGRVLIANVTEPKKIELCGMAFVSVCIWPLQYMVFQIHQPDTPYYAGLTLIAVGISWFRFRLSHYVAIVAQIFIPLLVGGYLHDTMGGFFLLNALFLGSVTMIGAVSRVFSEKLAEREFTARVQLQDEIKNRDSIIKAKTEAALKLQSLSKQFSPQIISSLECGKISLTAATHRSEICSIFVDIVGSTEKFISLDRDDLQKILSMYIDDVMGTFLKYDITIDKFMGDGVLGFSNDPAQHDDYIERVLKAALEILEKIELKRDLYTQYWLADFEVSVGIASGYASVGFYGSDLHVKSYTAIGRGVNLAARLGSAAEPNEILVSQDVMGKLDRAGSTLKKNILIKEKGVLQLKGFEQEKIRVYAIGRTHNHVSSVSSQDLQVCPNGHGLLYLDQDANNIYVFKCRFCDHVAQDALEVPRAQGAA